jgi:DNA-binding CsgD family transcriptional regulator
MPPVDDLLLSFCRGMADPVLALDGDGNVIAVNRAAERLFGIVETKAMGRPFRDVIGVPPGVFGLARARAGDGRAIDVKVERVPVDAVTSGRAAEVVVVRRVDGDGRVTRVPEQVTSGLPPRQAQVLTGLVAGHSEKEIASQLGLSPHTVHDHVKALYRRFHASGRADLVARALTADEKPLR